ncbi:hypothetical protein BH24ACT6_BH24ACT6_14590 [soil metagenome]
MSLESGGLALREVDPRAVRLAQLRLRGSPIIPESIDLLRVHVQASPTTFPPRDERCKVPPLLFQVVALVDPDSLEGCGFVEDPNYHENRKAEGIYNPNGRFSIIFG